MAFNDIGEGNIFDRNLSAMTSESRFRDEVYANIFQGIDDLFSEGDFCDLTVCVGDREYTCHRLILSSVSGFFRSSLTSHWEESSSGKICIDHKDVTEESFDLLLHILYKSEDVVTMETVASMLKLSVFLQIKFLENHCIHFIGKNMTPDSCLEIWQLAKKYEIALLAKKAFDMALKHFDRVIESEEFYSLNKAFLLILVSSRKSLNMDTVCQGILAWVEADPDSRKCCLGHLLSFVDFTQLSGPYLSELMKYLKHPFQDIMYDYVSDGMTFFLNDKNKTVQQQIEAQQHVILSGVFVQKCIAIIGGCSENNEVLNDFVVMPMDNLNENKSCNLPSLPEPCGLHFASCVWRNKLYVSGGSAQPRLFTAYIPGDNKWERLPNLKQGLQKHSMVAFDWNVYVLGGLRQPVVAESEAAPEIFIFSTKEQMWKLFAHLLVSVHSAAATTLGHRIYILGGQDTQARDIVQCVDTQTGCVYQAGCLPSPTFGAQALSSGYNIYLMRPEGDVLKMEEDFELADAWEQSLPEVKVELSVDLKVAEEKAGSESGLGGDLRMAARTSSPLFAEDGGSLELDVKVEKKGEDSEDEDSKEAAANFPNGYIDQQKQADEVKNALTIHFQPVASFPERQHFGAFLVDGEDEDKEIVVCGGRSKDGELLNDMVLASRSNGYSLARKYKLPDKMEHFRLHLMNIPSDLLIQASAKSELPSKGDALRLKSGAFPELPSKGDAVRLKSGALQLYADYVYDYDCLSETLVGIVLDQTDSVLDELSTCFRPLESSFLSAPIVPEEAMFFDDVRANIFQGIGNIFSDGDLCDLTVYVGDKEFACHRLILSAVSGFFKSSLTSSWRESSTGKIHVNHEDVTEESFALLLLALYKGKDVVNMETVKGVLKMSVFLQIKFLENHCVSFLSKNMTPLSSLGLWQFAEKYELSVLSQRAFAMALKNVEVVCASKEFQQLNKALLPVLLFSKNINMDTVCRGLLLWVEADLDSRKCHLGQFLPYVDFTQLSRQYLNELLKYMKPPFQEIMYDYITDGLSFVLNDEDKMVQQKIEARQHTVIKSKYVQKCVTLIGGCTDNHQPFNDFVALCPTIQGRCKLYNLELLPEPCGLHFASCVWRNKLYVSGGSTQPKLFAGYSPCDNKWEKLPSLMQGLQKHSMLAFDWNVYVLGGLKQQFTTENVTVSEISVFNTKNCTWKHFSNLLVSIHSAAAVSLGHRIYVLGGQDAVGQARDIVQCVDTQTGCVYQAGRLPSPSFGAQALSRGHGIYLVRAEGDVLEMKENYELADEWEGALADQKSTLGATASNSFEKDGQNLSPPFAEDGSSLHQDVKEEETRNVNEDEDENYQASDVFLTEKVVEEKNALTVHFKSIATFPKRQHFGSFLQQDLMVVVCGGESEDGELLSDLVSLSVGDKQGFLINCKLPDKMAYIGVHLLNIPRDLLAKACSKAIGSPNIGDKVKLRAGALEIYRDDFDYFGLTESHIGTVTKVPDTSTVTVKFQRGRELTFFTSDIELVD